MPIFRWIFAPGLAALATGLTGCERLFDKGSKEDIAAAEKKAKAGNYRGAVALYEAAFDGTSATAEVHYRLAVIYDEKLKSPVDAMHHFQRYLELSPNGPFAREAKAYKQEGDRKLLASLSKGAPMTQDEGVRLKNENLALRKQIVELRTQKALSQGAVAKGEVRAPLAPGSRQHIVQAGETLASISQKYYKTRNRAQDIQDANHNQLGGKSTIKPGQMLIVP
jgi:tetratricopeptide (TPR) repeat protein